ncbi:hypothetical protein [Acrocarpospora sp. B8E8]|uniref:hypothetical protein n=1 Tax=Acrocarpospora sp. B8E8 TaxID=3153572 RepID=UPI00325FC47E
MTAPDEQMLRQAADRGDISAITELAHLLLLLEQAGDQETDEEQAAVAESYEWALQAAEAGNLDAMYLTGMLLIGEGDMEQAQTWIRQD